MSCICNISVVPSVCLVSLCITLFILNVVTCLRSLFIAGWYSVVWLNHSLFIHSPVVGHLGCFQFWVFWIKLLWILPRSLCGHMYSVQFSSVSRSRVRRFATPWTTAHQASLSTTNSWSLPKLMSIESVMPSNHLIICCPLLLLPSIFPSIRVFSNESTLRIRWPKYWSFSFNISPSNEHPGQISFRMDWLDLLAVQGALKSLLQHHSSKASIFRHSAFFTV